MSFIHSISVRALAKNSSFGFFSVGFRVGKKPNVLFVRLAFFVCCPTFCVYDLWRFSKHFLVGLHQIYLKAQTLNLPLYPP